MRIASDVRAKSLQGAMRAQIRDAVKRVATFTRKTADLAADVLATETRRRQLADYLRGWWIEAIAVFGAIAFCLEWYPSRLVAYAFDISDPIALNIVTAGIAVLGWLLGFMIGELAAAYRKPQPRSTVRQIALILAVAGAVGYLAMGFQNRLVYATIIALEAKSQMLEPWKIALSLSALSALGIIVAFLTGVLRESTEATALRRACVRLNRELNLSNANLAAAEDELDEAEAAYRDAFPDAPTIVVGRPASFRRRKSA